MAVRPPVSIKENTTWKVLIIDDDEDDFLIAREMLREAKGRKFDVRWAHTYGAGQEELFSNHYHAVLVDYDLGAHSGIELIREANERGYAAPLILFTGRGNYEVDVEAMQAGATLYLSKGEVNPLLLERSIRYAIETKQRENDLRDARETAERELVERRRVEEALRRIDARWNAAIENLDVGAIIATEDEQVIYWNPAARQMHGFSSPEEGIEPLERTPITFQLWTPGGSHLLELDEWPMRRIKRGEPVRNLELRIRRPDQGWEKVFSYSGAMVDTSGGERLIFLTCHDLTEQRRTEDALRESEERLRIALDAARMVAWDYDPSTLKVTFSENAEQVLELPQRHETSDQGYGLIHAEDVEKHRALVNQAIATGGGYVSVYRHPHPEKAIWLEEHGRAIVDHAGKTVRLVGVVQNISDRKQAEEALRESQSRLVDFVENIHNNYIALDHQWRFTYANRHYGEVMGVDPQNLIGKNYWELFPQYIGTELEQNYRKAMAEKVPLHFIQRGVYTKNAYEVSLFPTHEGIAVFSIDRTEEMHRQQQLEDERARLDTILQALPVGVWIADAGGRIVGKNEQADQIWAGNAPMLEKVDQYREYPAWDAETGKELEPEEYPMALALHSGQRVERKELRIRRLDGSEGFVLVSAAPFKDNEGRVIGVVGINLDITARKRAEEQLTETDARLRSFVNANIVGVTMYREDGVLIQANDYYLELVGHTREELEAGLLNWRSFTPTEYLPDEDQAMAELKAGGISPGYEKEYIRPDGSRVWVVIRRALLPDGTFSAFAFDMTDWKQAEKALAETAEKLAQSNQDLEEFAFVASHDLQEPLRKIIMFGDLLRRHLSNLPDETAEETLNRIQDAAGRMQAMINGLLDLSRIHSRGRDFVRLDLNQVVEEVASDLEARIRSVNGQVIIENLPAIQGDELQLHELFQNLINNALKFHKPDVRPVVRVSGTVNRKASPPTAEIRVEDNGIGFEQENAERIFHPFQRLHGSGEYEGSGLGLAICRKIVERHHGSIEVESFPGKGSTFILRLPAG